MNIKLYIILKLYFLLIKTLYFYTLYFCWLYEKYAVFVSKMLAVLL